MAGEARTSDFLLTTATVMIGPSAKVMELNPLDHSIGLVKNVQVTTEPQFVELTQGVEAQVIASVNVANPARISGEVYEFTARNMAYGAGVDASSTDYDPIVEEYELGAAITNGGDSITMEAGSGADFAAGDFMVIQDVIAGDRLHVGKVASIATDVITLATGYTMPTGMTFAVATTKIFKVRAIKVGSNARRPNYGIKMVGQLPETGEPITLIFPKAKVTRGIGLAFQNENFSNMPFEFTPYALVPTDPFYGDFGGTKPWMILKR